MTLQEALSRKHRHFVKHEAAGHSAALSALTWRRLMKNGLAKVSLLVIGLFAIVAILGYLITPDHTPHCNQQYLELAALKPGSKATFIYYDNGTKHPKTGLHQRMLRGEPLEGAAVPVHAYREEGDSILAETLTGNTPNNGETLRFAKKDVHEIKTRTFLFGTDGYGRDVLSQIMIGSRVSLSVGFIAVAIALLIGVALGALAAYYGRWVDNLVMWLVNVVWSIPTVLLVIAITFALGKGFWQIFVAVGLTMWVDIARVVRGQVLGIKEKEYVEAARALGYGPLRIIFRHILPNILGAVVVVAASNFASAILLEAGLSFLGMGVQPPTPSWGSMVKENYGYILLDNAYLAIIPGIAIMLIVLAFMLLGNGVRDALDVKDKS
ncbi:MAG: ABC transporter permease [Bacteroidales bacterium]|nr:ABC transporter permease [Bacteroidales bacterium]